MSQAEADPVAVQILDKEFLIACPPGERPALTESAALLNSRLREIRGAGKVIGLDRMMVMAALNMANEISRLREREQRVETQVGGRVRQLRERVEKAVARSQQLEL
jgi:cell division protein ZapA